MEPPFLCNRAVVVVHVGGGGSVVFVVYIYFPRSRTGEYAQPTYNSTSSLTTRHLAPAQALRG